MHDGSPKRAPLDPVTAKGTESARHPGTAEGASRRLGAGVPIPTPISSSRTTPYPRLAVVVASLDILGGQGVQARSLIEHLRQDGYHVDLVPINPPFPRPLQWLRKIPYLRTAINQLIYLPSLRKLRHVDIVHVFSASYWSFLLAPVPAMLAARMLGKHVVLNYHSGEADDHLAHWGRRVHPWLRLAHQIVVPSAYLQRVFARYGYPTQVVNNVVDTSSFQFRERLPLRPRLLSTRNLEAHYRVDVSVRALAMLRERFPDATLWIAGIGSEERRLRRMAERLAPNSVYFLGRVEPQAMPGLYEQADIFVNASEVDNQPLSVLEAFAAGAPVISTPTGDIASMVRDGETGRLIPPDDPQAMADAVANLLENPERARDLARRARREVERYAWPQVRAGWDAVYARGLR